MADAGTDSDESAGKVQEWEVVSLSTLSLSGSTSLCACESCTAGSQHEGGSSDGEARTAATVLSNHFGSSTSSPMLEEYLGSETERRATIVEENRNADFVEFLDRGCDRHLSEPVDQEHQFPVPLADNDDAKEVEYDYEEQEMQEDERKKDASQTLDWKEPMPLNAEILIRDDSDGASSTTHDMECHKKLDGVECDEVTLPVLGSCSSATSGLNSAAAFDSQLGRDNLVPSTISGREVVANCIVEEELEGIDREILGADSVFGSFHEASTVSTKALDVDHGDLTESLLGEGGEDYAYEAWWKRGATLLYVQARQANTLWSLALAAAVMGLVILGQRWQHERCQNQHLRLQLCSKDEKISELLFQVARLKNMLPGRRRVPVLRSISSYSGFHDRF